MQCANISWRNALWLDILIDRVFCDGFNKEKNEILVELLAKGFGVHVPFTAFQYRLASKQHKVRMRPDYLHKNIRTKLEKTCYKMKNFEEVVKWLSVEKDTPSGNDWEEEKIPENAVPPVTEELLRENTSKVLVVYCGGTFGMTGKPLAPNSLEKLIEIAATKIPQFSTMFKGICDAVSIHPPIDSSGASPANWYDIAQVIKTNLIDTTRTSCPYKYRGVVVIHGTDTLAYTAAALHYLLSYIPVPIVVTGSQKPLLGFASDALNNFLGSVEVALYDDKERTKKNTFTPGVSCFFNRRLMMGGSLVKQDCLNYNAFDSPRQSYIAIQNAIELNMNNNIRENLVNHVKGRPFQLLPGPSSGVVLIHLFPGITPLFMDKISQSAKGIVLLAYGTGNGPEWMLHSLKQLIERNLVVAINTECLKGGVGDEYAASLVGQLRSDPDMKKRFIDCGYLTPEAAIAKLAITIGKLGDPEKITKELQLAIVNEWEELKDNGMDPSGGDNEVGLAPQLVV